MHRQWRAGQGWLICSSLTFCEQAGALIDTVSRHSSSSECAVCYSETAPLSRRPSFPASRICGCTARSPLSNSHHPKQGLAAAPKVRREGRERGGMGCARWRTATAKNDGEDGSSLAVVAQLGLRAVQPHIWVGMSAGLPDRPELYQSQVFPDQVWCGRSNAMIYPLAWLS